MLARGASTVVTRVWFPRGHHVTPHVHGEEQCAYVIRGQIRLTVDDKVRILRGGDAYVVPKAAVYSVIAARPTELIVIRLAGDFGEAPEFQADVADPGLDRDSPKP